MKSTNFRLLFSLILLLSFITIGSSQTLESDETSDIEVPEQAMEQVVRRILVWHFKPRNKKKIIYLAEKGVQKSWLPKIKGIEFQLLSETEIEEKESFYFFIKLEKRLPDKYHIGFAFGDPTCNYTGDSWYFRSSKKKVGLWKPNKGFGAGCGHSSD